ncbi:MAG: hypothetical protein ABI837_00130, partial [Acidobacteriota bacterium]
PQAKDLKMHESSHSSAPGWWCEPPPESSALPGPSYLEILRLRAQDDGATGLVPGFLLSVAACLSAVLRSG